MISGLSVCQTEDDEEENAQETSAKRPCISTVLIMFIDCSYIAENVRWATGESRQKYPNKCVKSEREICALRSLDNEWPSINTKVKTIQTVRAVDALLLISISHNGNGQEAPPSGIFGSQQLIAFCLIPSKIDGKHIVNLFDEWLRLNLGRINVVH